MTTYSEYSSRSIKILKISGIWIDGPPTIRNIVAIFYHLLAFVTVLILQTMFFFKTDNLTVSGIIDIVVILPLYITGLIRVIFFIYKQKSFKSIVKFFDELVAADSSLERTGRKFKKRSDFVIRLIIMQGVIGITSWFFGFPFVSHELPYKMWLPYDYLASQTRFTLTVIWQQSLAFVPFTASFIAEFYPAFFLNITAGAIEELGDRIEKIGKKKIGTEESVAGTSKKIEENIMQTEQINRSVQRETTKELENCIEFHLKIKNVVKNINDIFGTVICIQGFSSSLTLCALCYALINVSENLIAM
jgi:hypothetical protein